MVENTDYKNTYVYTGLDDYELTFFYDVTSSVVVEWISPTGALSGAKTEGVDYSIVRVGAVAYVRVLIDFGTGGQITAYREMPYTQTFRGIDGQDPAPSSIETAFDRIVYMVQQIAGRIVGALRLPANESMDMTIPSAVARRGGIAAYADDADAQPIVLDGVTGTPVSTFMAEPLVAADGDEFCGDVGAALAADATLTDDNFINTVGYGGWEAVGSALDITTATFPALGAMSSTRIAFVDNDSDTIQAYDFSGSAWAAVGSAFSLGSVISPGVAALSSTRIVVTDQSSDELQAYDFDGSIWTAVGNPLTILGTGSTHAVDALSATSIILLGKATNLATYTFDETNWSLSGTALTIAADTETDVCALSTTSVVVANGDGFTQYGWTGSTWAAIGTEVAIVTIRPSITALSSTLMALTSNGLTPLISILECTGGEFRIVSGNDIYTTGDDPIVAALSSTRVVYIDEDTHAFQTYDRVSPVAPPSPAFS